MKPRIGITLGDPAGIGYEVTAKALSRLRGKVNADFVLIGSRNQFLKVLNILNLGVDDVLGNIDFIDVPGQDIEFGKVQKEAGRISLESVRLGGLS